MTNTSNSMANLINESNISFNDRDISYDTGAILTLDYIRNNQLLKVYEAIQYIDLRSKIQDHNSNSSFFEQIIFRYVTGYPTQSDHYFKVLQPQLHQ
ncbi:hypothetical protein [Ileibacterium valens]|uniref:hypothetical protein n=1 Tax=Ileibacterium valens TaxID=1862668 RepID=UPI00272D5ED9|nr:hypothetical protein [Ileibacterium valens]